MKTFVRIITGSAIAFITLVILVFLIQPRIPLGLLSGPVSSFLTFLTGSEQVISGNYFLVPGSWTTLSVENGSLNLTGKDEFKLKTEINSAQTTLHLWSLLSKEINLDGIILHGMSIDIFTGKKDEPSKEKIKQDKDRSISAPYIVRQTGIIDLADIAATITSQENKEALSYKLLTGKGELSQELPGHISIDGVINDKKFQASLEGGPLAELSGSDSDWPFSFQVDHKSLRADVTGTMARLKTDPHIQIQASLAGENFDDLVSIFGGEGSVDQPFSINGTADLSEKLIKVNIPEIRAGSQSIQIAGSIQNIASAQPHYALQCKGGKLDLDELKGFLSTGHPKLKGSKDQKEKTQIDRDDVVFPGAFPVSNLTIDFDLNELVMAGKMMRDIQLDIVIEDGAVTKSPFRAATQHASFSGYFSLDIDDEVPQLSAHLETSALNLGGVLQELQVADDMVIRLDNTSTDLNTSGRTLGELFDTLEFTIHASDGLYEYQDPNTKAVIPISMDKTSITGKPGDKVAVMVHGKISANPVLISMEFDDQRDEQPGSVKEIPTKLYIEIAGANWELTGKIPLPFRKEGITLHSKLSGERLDSLNELFPVQLPEIGPYAVDGKFSIVPEGYRLNGIKVQVGSSSLIGDFSIDTKAKPPAVTIDLQSPVIQLDDFKNIWINSQKTEENTQEKEISNTNEPAQKKNKLSDQEVLNRFNAFIHVAVDKVLSGKDHLGSGTLTIKQEDGSLKIDPLNIQLPAGSASADLTIEPSSSNHVYRLNILIENLDYGVVGRWFKPDTDMSGIINLRTSIESESPDRQSIMANGSGYLDFSFQPRQLRSGVIDLWAVNIFSYLIPFLAPKGDSAINCAAGRFNIEEGILTQDELLIDTTKIQVKGDVEVDFKTQLIDATLRPIPKRPQFYSLSTPINIQGKLSDLNVGVSAGSIIGTVIRLATSYIVVPMQWIIQNNLPEDGTPACLKLVEERPVK